MASRRAPAAACRRPWQVTRVTRLRARDLERLDPSERAELDPSRQVVRPDGVDERAVLSVLRVPPELAGSRVDRFVQGELRRTSRTRAQFIVRASAYAFDGRALRPGSRVQAEQRIALWRPPWDEEATEVPIPILLDDGDLVFVDKPPNVPVHPTARYFASTVVKRLEAAGHGYLRLAHRIDRETSGVLLLTRSEEADRRVKAAFEERDGISKRYLALTWGVPTWTEHHIDWPLELDPTHPTRVKMRVASPGSGLVAATRARVLEVRSRGEARYALVECVLETGRQHQIRAHLAKEGVPIVGDKLYGPDDSLFAKGVDGELTESDKALLELPRHALHAAELALDHPLTGERVTVRSPLPADLATFWRDLRPASSLATR
jgi:23S rRNA pseudouridine1911/1915/1917 synthase